MSAVDIGLDMDSPWASILHPERVALYGTELEARAREARLFTTGMSHWDQACDDTGGGLDDYWYVVIGGASNVGKTQVAIALAKQAITQGFAVAFLTMEEPIEQIQRRVYAAVAETLSYYDFTYKHFSTLKMQQLCEAVPHLGRFLVNEDLPSYDVASITRWLDRARYDNPGPMVVLLDNLQLVKTAPGQSIGEAATDVSETLRNWAKRNRILTVALSQVTSAALREGKPVRYFDLWGGNAMYSNPSQVFMLDHLSARVDMLQPHIKRLWGLLDKNRYGPRMIAMPIEANLKTGEWRCADPDEHHLWADNPWAGKEERR
jgi:KaiC/GvpD/RAD55 family RecA-like ATPase